MSQQSKGSSSCRRLLVAAIDFGTTFSSWAFSFKHEFDSDPTKISSKQWIGGQHVSLKAPTTVLIKPDGRTLEAFGYEAENKYADLAADNAHMKYFYFKRFKMALFEKGLSRNMTLEDDKGMSLPAKTVFGLAIAFLREDLLKTCANRLAGGGLDESEIHWVLTVPAIWDDAAKQFMRESAGQGGIQSENLTIALEPEAASLFCRQIPIEKSARCKGSLSSFAPGSKYLVLDAGGGTVDITLHEVMYGGCLKELHKASGGAWGGTKVDEAFRQLLIKIFGKPVLRKFQKLYTEDYLDVFRDFEVKKRDITPNKDGKITMRIPSGLKDLFEEETQEDLKETIAQTAFGNEMSLMGDKLRINVSVYKNLFKDAIDSIVKHVKGLLRESCTRGTEAILMVGGFSESQMLQEAIRNNFPNLKLVIPDEAGLVVLKGAVVYGHSPSTIAERVCKYTYGIEMSSEFVEGKHDSRKKKQEGCKFYCKEIFHKHVEIGQTLVVGDKQAEQSYVPLTDTQSSIRFTVYASSNKDPSYVTDYGCTELGTAVINDIDMSVPLSSRNVKVGFVFGGTELEVVATEERTGKTARCHVNFLG